MKIRWKSLIINLIIPLAVGGLSAFLIRNSMEIYSQIQKPFLAPPPILFPIVWTILFLLMGVSTYILSASPGKETDNALVIYGLQLAVNFIWPLVFFIGQMYWLALAVIVILWILILAMIYSFHKISPLAGYLQIPYLLWVTLATYLNLMIAILN